MFFLFAGLNEHPKKSPDDKIGIYYTYDQAMQANNKLASTDWARITDSHLNVLWER